MGSVIRYRKWVVTFVLSISTVLYSFSPGWASETNCQNLSPNSNLSYCSFEGRDFSFLDLSGVVLEGANLSGADLTGANLSGSILTKAILKETNLQWATLENASITDSELDGAQFDYANLTGLTSYGNTGNPIGIRATSGYLIGKRVDLSHRDLSGLDLAYADLQYATLVGVNLSGADLRHSSLNQADLTGANLSSARISDADIASARLINSNLSGADVSGVFATGVDFENAELESVKFTSSDLRNSSFINASLSRADLSGVLSENIQGPPRSLPSGVVLENGHLIGPNMNLNGYNLAGADLTDADLRGAKSGSIRGIPERLPDGWVLDRGVLFGPFADLRDTEIFRVPEGADLNGVQSGRTVLTQCCLPVGWTFANGYLIGPGANIRGADLRNANLEGIDLSESNLDIVQSGGIKGIPKLPTGYKMFKGYILGPRVQLQNVDFRNADLTDVNLEEAVLVGSNFNGATLTRANFNGSNLNVARLIGALFDETKAENTQGMPLNLPTDVKVIQTGDLRTYFKLQKPQLEGSLTVGGRVTAKVGYWPQPLNLTYGWFRDDKPLEGENGTEYKFVPGDVARNITFRVTAKLESVLIAEVSSIPAKVTLGRMVPTKPKLMGTFKAGLPIKVVCPPWVIQSQLTYKWTLNGSPIKGATKPSFTLPKNSKGKKIAVTVTQKAVGYVQASMSSTSILIK